MVNGGENGSSALGVEYPATINNGGVIRCGYGGGGGGSGAANDPSDKSDTDLDDLVVEAVEVLVSRWKWWFGGTGGFNGDLVSGDLVIMEL